MKASRSFDEHNQFQLGKIQFLLCFQNLEESKDNLYREYHHGGIEGDSSRSYDDIDQFKGRVSARINKRKDVEISLYIIQCFIITNQIIVLDPIELQRKLEEERKLQFRQTFKNSNLGRKSGASFFCIVGIAFFMQLYFSHVTFVDDLLYIQKTIPTFLNRYRYTNTMIVILRDRAIFNNSLESYEPYEGYGYNLINHIYKKSALLFGNADTYYKDKSLDNERDIVHKLYSLYKQFKPIKTTSLQLCFHCEYQGVIGTIFAACEAARQGDIEILKSMMQEGTVDFNLGDYDENSPIFYAVKTNRLDVVNYSDINRDNYGLSQFLRQLTTK